MKPENKPNEKSNESVSRREAFYSRLGSKHTRIEKNGARIVTSNKPTK